MFNERILSEISKKITAGKLPREGRRGWLQEEKNHRRRNSVATASLQRRDADTKTRDKISRK